MNRQKYFVEQKKGILPFVKVFLSLLFVFAVVFFLWSVMRYNQIMDERAEKEAYIEQLQDNISELQYWVDMPLDDNFKIRIAREKLGMCFPDEIIYYTDID